MSSRTNKPPLRPDGAAPARGKRQVRCLVKSFGAALCGIRACVRHERNMRIHLCAAAGVLLLSLFYPFTALHYAVLAVVFAQVIGAEMLNTAVERAVDIQSQGYNRLAKLAKDIAAGAVFVCALAAAAVGLLFFVNGEGVRAVLDFARARPAALFGGGAAYLMLAAAFIFLPGRGE